MVSVINTSKINNFPTELYPHPGDDFWGKELQYSLEANQGWRNLESGVAKNFNIVPPEISCLSEAYWYWLKNRKSLGLLGHRIGSSEERYKNPHNDFAAILESLELAPSVFIGPPVDRGYYVKPFFLSSNSVILKMALIRPVWLCFDNLLGENQFLPYMPSTLDLSDETDYRYSEFMEIFMGRWEWYLNSLVGNLDQKANPSLYRGEDFEKEVFESLIETGLINVGGSSKGNPAVNTENSKELRRVDYNGAEVTHRFSYDPYGFSLFGAKGELERYPDVRHELVGGLHKSFTPPNDNLRIAGFIDTTIWLPKVGIPNM